MEKGTDGAPVTDIVAENEQHEPGRTSEFNLTDGSSKSARMPVEGQPTPTEAELRRLYEEEEIERFLGLFADSVSEVKRPSKNDEIIDLFSDEPWVEEITTADSPSIETLESEWLTVKKENIPKRLPSSFNGAQSISEKLALKYVSPILPPARARPDRFTVGRLRLSIQRLYLVAHPAYGSFFSHLTKLATWEDRRTSGLYCLLFWVLWYRNLLAPAAFSRILFGLLRRRLLPYPTMQELKARRKEAAMAEELGEELQVRLGSTSQLGLLEAWRLVRVFGKPSKAKAKKQKQRLDDKAKQTKGTDEKATDTKNRSTTSATATDPQDHSQEVEIDAPIDESTILDNAEESKEEKDFKRALLNFFNDIADLHERVRNIMLWRSPGASRSYAILLVLLIVLTGFLSTKYIIKIGLSICGLLFWHVVPILASLPPEDLERLPPLFDNAPTDAEYAMELISGRVARGESVRPAQSLKRKKSGTKDKKGKDTSPTHGTSGEALHEKQVKPRQGEVDWRKWGDKAQTLQKWAGHAGLLGPMSRQNEPSRQPTTQALEGDTYTYLAHYRALPGMISLSSDALAFVPATSTKPKLRIALDDVRGVKKIGMSAMPGLSVTWRKGPDSTSYNETRAELALSSTVTVEEKFWWVGGRDEVFARLVAWGGRKWMHV